MIFISAINTLLRLPLQIVVIIFLKSGMNLCCTLTRYVIWHFHHNLQLKAYLPFRCGRVGDRTRIPVSQYRLLWVCSQCDYEKPKALSTSYVSILAATVTMEPSIDQQSTYQYSDEWPWLSIFV